MATAVAAGLTGCQAAFDPASVPDATPEEVTRVEPLSWWTGMKTPLQLMVQGKDVGAKEIRFEGGKGVVAKAAHKAASPDYLFVPDPRAGEGKRGPRQLHDGGHDLPDHARPLLLGLPRQ